MSPRPPSADPVFIVGLYKNGTSWLLSALAAHPEFAALRELDVLRSVAGRSGRRLLPPHERLANVFGRSAFCALRAEQLQSARPFYDLPPEEAVAGLARLLAPDGGKGGHWPSQGRPLGFQNFAPELLARGFAALRDATTSAEAMDGFLAALAPGLPTGRRPTRSSAWTHSRGGDRMRPSSPSCATDAMPPYPPSITANSCARGVWPGITAI
jgi:hypothetical protein